MPRSSNRLSGLIGVEIPTESGHQVLIPLYARIHAGILRMACFPTSSPDTFFIIRSKPTSANRQPAVIPAVSTMMLKR